VYVNKCFESNISFLSLDVELDVALSIRPCVFSHATGVLRGKDSPEPRRVELQG